MFLNVGVCPRQPGLYFPALIGTCQISRSAVSLASLSAVCHVSYIKSNSSRVFRPLSSPEDVFVHHHQIPRNFCPAVCLYLTCLGKSWRLLPHDVCKKKGYVMKTQQPGAYWKLQYDIQHEILGIALHSTWKWQEPKLMMAC